MSLETSTHVFIAIMCLGLLTAVYVLIRDRVDILRSIKPNNLSEFFGMYPGYSSIFYTKRILLRFIVNLFALFIWIPFWILDRIFKLNIFEENNQK